MSEQYSYIIAFNRVIFWTHTRSRSSQEGVRERADETRSEQSTYAAQQPRGHS